MIAGSMPTAPEALARLKGRRVYFDPLTGDNGTRLIEIGTRWLLSDLVLTLVPSCREAEAIVLNGGIWNARRAAAIETYSRLQPQLPIVVMPTTFTWTPCLPERVSEITLLSRDMPSLQYLAPLQNPGSVTIGIDDDAAFLLTHTEFFRSLKAEVTALKHVLVVERQDMESKEGLTISSALLPSISTNLKEMLPQGLRMALKRPINRRRWKARTPEMSGSLLATEGLDWLAKTHPDINTPILVADVGLPDFFSFREYTTLIRDASAVLTSRLHVAILAALLGKPTYLQPGANHKIPGVYEYSMKHLSNVTFTH